MFPKDFQQTDLVLFLFFNNLMQSLKFNQGLKKEITLYTSCLESDRMRKIFIDFLKNYRFEADHKVERVTDVDLSIS
jgi:hypothetical protein